MHQRAKKGFAVALATGGLLFSGTGLALADAGATSSSTGDNGVLTGNNVNIPINAPITLCGNSIAVLGIAANASCTLLGGASGGSATASAQSTGDNGVLAGNNVQAPINAPVTICGNSIAVVGLAANSSCDIHGGTGHSSATATSSQNGDNGILSGNGLNVPVNVPILACGNSIGVLGVAANSSCVVHDHKPPPHPTPTPTMPTCPPTTPPVTTPPVTTPPVTSPPVTTPPVTKPPTHTVTTPPVTPPGHHHHHHDGHLTSTTKAPAASTVTPEAASAGSLAHTGADVMGLAAAGGALVLGGAGLVRISARRKH